MFYAVWNGKEGNKIYNNWDDCKANTNGISGVKFKKFKSESEAMEFIKSCDEDHQDHQIFTDDGEISYPCAFVDGSINPKTGTPSFAYILLLSKNAIPIERSGTCSENTNERNVVGELTAAQYAIMESENILELSEINIYHDYNGIREFAKGTWNAKSPAAK